MKTHLFLLCSFFCGCNLFSQTFFREKSDSLLGVYRGQTELPAKVETLGSLIDLYIYNDATVAKSYTLEMMSISENGDYGEGMILSHLNLGYYYYTLEKMDSATFHMQKTLDLAKMNGVETGVVKALSNLSLIQGHKGDYASAIKLMDSVANIYLMKKDYLNYGVSINNNAAHYYDQGDYLKAMEGYRHALKILDTIDREPYRKADVLRNIGKLNTRQGNHNKALDYFSQALTVYLEIEDNLYAASTLIDMGSVHSNLEDDDQAIEYYKRGLEVSIRSNNPSTAILAYGNMGIAYKDQGKYVQAIENLKKCLTYDKQELSDINEVIYLYQIGNAYTLSNDFANAASYLNRSVALATSGRIGNEMLNALNYRSLNFEKSGQLENALVDIKKSQEIKDSLFSMEKTKQIEELQAIYETEKKEAAIGLQKEEIKTLNERAKVDKLSKGLYAGGMFSFVTISGLLYFGFRQRIKKNRIAREKQEEIYRREIEYKKKELASQTLHLVQKNTFIQELKENLEHLRGSPERFKIEFRRIVMLLKKQSAEDQDWEVFKTYFAQVHNDFDQKLKTIYSDITEKEIRLAAFLRMNLSTKEIAAMLNVMPDSILKSKYRLKKKLQLDKEIDLNSFLNTL